MHMEPSREEYIAVLQSHNEGQMRLLQGTTLYAHRSNAFYNAARGRLQRSIDAQQLIACRSWCSAWVTMILCSPEGTRKAPEPVGRM